MPSGEAPIAEASTVQALLSRQWSRREPPSRGLVSLLTIGFWAVWLYLVMPLISLLLWVFGVRFFVEELTKDGLEGLRNSLVSYSSILLVLVGLLGLWITWNVVRYGGSNDRRTAKRAEVTDPEIAQAFHLDEGQLATMRAERHVRIDLDRDGRVVLTTVAALPEQGPDDRGPDRPDPRRDRARA